MAHATLSEKTTVIDAFFRLGSRRVKVAGYQELLVVLDLEHVMSATRLKRATGSLIHGRLLRISRGDDEPMRNSYKKRPLELSLTDKVMTISS